MQQIQLLRPQQAFAVVGRRRSSFYSDIERGVLPPFIKIGRRASAIPAHELQQVAEARIAGKSEDEIRTLVRQLIAARK